MRTRLCTAIVEQANLFFYRHEQLFSGIADSIAVDDAQAINGTINDMFDSELFTKLQRAKLFRCLHKELWPDAELPPLRRKKQYAQNQEIKLRVIDKLCSMLRDEIPGYGHIVAERREFAADLSTHPDDVQVLVRA
jgi:hypothetical protein